MLHILQSSLLFWEVQFLGENRILQESTVPGRERIPSLRASLTLIEPEFGPRGPVPSQKVGLLLSFFLA